MTRERVRQVVIATWTPIAAVAEGTVWPLMVTMAEFAIWPLIFGLPIVVFAAALVAVLVNNAHFSQPAVPPMGRCEPFVCTTIETSPTPPAGPR